MTNFKILNRVFYPFTLNVHENSCVANSCFKFSLNVCNYNVIIIVLLFLLLKNSFNSFFFPHLNVCIYILHSNIHCSFCISYLYIYSSLFMTLTPSVIFMRKHYALAYFGALWLLYSCMYIIFFLIFPMHVQKFFFLKISIFVMHQFIVLM